jgi:hypothetical protein
MSSETSDSNNSSTSSRKKTSTKHKNTNFTTDMMVSQLIDEKKVRPEDQRIGYQRDDSDNKSYSSEDISNYISEKKNDNDSDQNGGNGKHETHGAHGAHGSNSNPSTNIFQKSINSGDNYKFDPNNKDGVVSGDGKDNGLPEDYDNYNELSEEGKMLKRLDMLRKLGELAQYKVKLSQNYNMNSDYFTMKYEYQLHTNIRAKQNYINWTSSLMLNCIYGIEILNDKYNPWELKLTGWSEQINADISNYYDVFGEIYEKYNKPGKSMSPELKLALMIGGSALKFHLNKVALSGKMGIPNPQFNGISNGPSNNFSGNFSGGYSNEQANTGQDPRVIEQMRQQAMLDKMREEQRKQSELLQKKTETDHEIANKQMQDMLLLQQKQTEFMQQEAMKKQKFMEFERIRNAMEQQTQPKPFGALNEYAGTNLNNNMNNSNQMSPSRNVYVEQRKQDIGQQLEAMKSNVSNIKLKSQDMRDLAADKLYPQTGPNVKKRSDGISVDTSSSSSESSSTESSNSTSTSSSSSEVKAKSKSSNGKSSNGSKKNQVEKSISSRNNQSSYSKRKYKRAGITIDT